MPLATIAGRVPVVEQHGSVWIINDPVSRELLDSHGVWGAYSYYRITWPTEAAALAFAREVAEREAGESK
jgi:hypothetical protein